VYVLLCSHHDWHIYPPLSVHALHRAVRPAMQGPSLLSPRQGALSRFESTRLHSDRAQGLSPSLAAEVDHQNQLLLLQQLDLHAKLHEQLLVQQRAQVELSMKLSCKPHAVLVPDQIMRLAQHVMLQRQLLQHLVAMLHVYLDEPVSRSCIQVRVGEVEGRFELATAALVHSFAPLTRSHMH